MRKNVAKNGASIATRSPLRARKRVNNRLAEQNGHSEPIRAKSGTEPRKNARNGAKSERRATSGRRTSRAALAERPARTERSFRTTGDLENRKHGGRERYLGRTTRARALDQNDEASPYLEQNDLARRKIPLERPRGAKNSPCHGHQRSTEMAGTAQQG